MVGAVDMDSNKPNFGLEPLPDIDFNIRSGNTLVGFATEKELKDTIQYDKNGSVRMDFGHNILDKFKEECQIVATAYKHFQNSQLISDKGTQAHRNAKKELQTRLDTLNEKLNKYLAYSYGITKYEDLGGNNGLFPSDGFLKQTTKKYNTWLESHQPFHWFAEFYEIINGNGGFDVVIGNPPYLEIRQINYDVKNYLTRDSNAVHSMCIERSIKLTRVDSSISMIVPLSLVCTQRMQIVQELIEKQRATWYSNYAWRPGKLFDQVNRALTIFICTQSDKQVAHSTPYQKWNADNREFLIKTLTYTTYLQKRSSFWFPKLTSPIETYSLAKLLQNKSSTPIYKGNTEKKVYYRTTGGLYWKVFTNFSPKFFINGRKDNSSRETSFSIINKNTCIQIVSILSSNTFWWWYTLTSNLRDLNPSDINGFKFGENVIEDKRLLDISNSYLKSLQNNSHMLQRIQKNIGTTETQSFKISKSKLIIDQIDTILAQHYGFTEEELDFIINYDIKYRMGKELEAYVEGILGKENGEGA